MLNDYQHVNTDNSGALDVYLDKYVVVLHQQGVVVDFAEELSRHHFVWTVLDETGNIQVTCRDTQEQTEESVTGGKIFILFFKVGFICSTCIWTGFHPKYCNTFYMEYIQMCF